ncbi:MAG TPA: hypothetical protein VGG01_24685 [Xanthobacteraceae bacterium]|jgi:hypothetical protein
MKQRAMLALSAPVVGMASSYAAAQSAPPTYQADPDVYKVIFEDSNFRVIEAIRKKGVHDKTHGHPVPAVIYSVSGCSPKLYGADGKIRMATSKAETAMAVPIIVSHSAENVGPADCHEIFVERK